MAWLHQRRILYRFCGGDARYAALAGSCPVIEYTSSLDYGIGPTLFGCCFVEAEIQNSGAPSELARRVETDSPDVLINFGSTI
jgi:hypothetical protein